MSFTKSKKVPLHKSFFNLLAWLGTPGVLKHHQQRFVDKVRLSDNHIVGHGTHVYLDTVNVMKILHQQDTSLVGVDISVANMVGAWGSGYAFVFGEYKLLVVDFAAFNLVSVHTCDLYELREIGVDPNHKVFLEQNTGVKQMATTDHVEEFKTLFFKHAQMVWPAPYIHAGECELALIANTNLLLLQLGKAPIESIPLAGVKEYFKDTFPIADNKGSFTIFVFHLTNNKKLAVSFYHDSYTLCVVDKDFDVLLDTLIQQNSGSITNGLMTLNKCGVYLDLHSEGTFCSDPSYLGSFKMSINDVTHRNIGNDVYVFDMISRETGNYIHIVVKSDGKCELTQDTVIDDTRSFGENTFFEDIAKTHPSKVVAQPFYNDTNNPHSIPMPMPGIRLTVRELQGHIDKLMAEGKFKTTTKPSEDAPSVKPSTNTAYADFAQATDSFMNIFIDTTLLENYVGIHHAVNKLKNILSDKIKQDYTTANPQSTENIVRPLFDFGIKDAKNVLRNIMLVRGGRIQTEVGCLTILNDSELSEPTLLFAPSNEPKCQYRVPYSWLQSYSHNPITGHEFVFCLGGGTMLTVVSIKGLASLKFEYNDKPIWSTGEHKFNMPNMTTHTSIERLKRFIKNSGGELNTNVGIFRYNVKTDGFAFIRCDTFNVHYLLTKQDLVEHEFLSTGERFTFKHLAASKIVVNISETVPVLEFTPKLLESYDWKAYWKAYQAKIDEGVTEIPSSTDLLLKFKTELAAEVPVLNVLTKDVLVQLINFNVSLANPGNRLSVVQGSKFAQLLSRLPSSDKWFQYVTVEGVNIPD